MNLPQVSGAASAAPADIQHLSFRVRQARYALPIELVREIIEYGQITGVPMMPACIHGVINLRGNVVPVLDLAARFGMERTLPGKRTCIVIIELEQAADVEPAPAFGAGIRTEFIAGMARDERGFTIILDVRKVLSLDDILQISQAMAQAS